MIHFDDKEYVFYFTNLYSLSVNYLDNDQFLSHVNLATAQVLIYYNEFSGVARHVS
jgi:hypothetical protein